MDLRLTPDLSANSDCVYPYEVRIRFKFVSLKYSWILEFKISVKELKKVYDIMSTDYKQAYNTLLMYIIFSA